MAHSWPRRTIWSGGLNYFLHHLNLRPIDCSHSHLCQASPAVQGDTHLLGTRHVFCVLATVRVNSQAPSASSLLSLWTHRCAYVFIQVHTHRHLGIGKFLCSLLTFLVVPESFRALSYPTPTVKQCQRGEEQSSSECNASVMLRNLVCQARYCCASVNLSLWSKFTVEFNA